MSNKKESINIGCNTTIKLCFENEIEKQDSSFELQSPM